MDTGYKVWGQDISNLLEFFTNEELSGLTVVDSRLSNNSGNFKKNNIDLKTSLSGIFPTSAGSDYPGGYNLLPFYRTNGEAIDVALKGCRPIGIKLKDLGPGEYTIYRKDAQTFFTSGTKAVGGERLLHDPLYIFFELQGAGGGGGGTKDLYSGSGGGSGAYIYRSY